MQPTLAMAQDFPRYDGRAHAANKTKCSQRRYHCCDRCQREQDERPVRPAPKDPAGRVEEKRDMGEEIQRHASAECDCGDGV